MPTPGVPKPQTGKGPLVAIVVLATLLALVATVLIVVLSRDSNDTPGRPSGLEPQKSSVPPEAMQILDECAEEPCDVLDAQQSPKTNIYAPRSELGGMTFDEIWCVAYLAPSDSEPSSALLTRRGLQWDWQNPPEDEETYLQLGCDNYQEGPTSTPELDTNVIDLLVDWDRCKDPESCIVSAVRSEATENPVNGQVTDEIWCVVLRTPAGNTASILVTRHLGTWGADPPPGGEKTFAQLGCENYQHTEPEKPVETPGSKLPPGALVAMTDHCEGELCEVLWANESVLDGPGEVDGFTFDEIWCVGYQDESETRGEEPVMLVREGRQWRVEALNAMTYQEVCTGW